MLSNWASLPTIATATTIGSRALAATSWASATNVDSGVDDILLIGDAGGFPNKLSYEGLYYAMVTGRNAARAIIEGKPFRETNADIFRRKRRERPLAKLFYSRWGLLLIRLCSLSNRVVKKIFDLGIG